jgi:hypothetical protein
MQLCTLMMEVEVNAGIRAGKLLNTLPGQLDNVDNIAA